MGAKKDKAWYLVYTKPRAEFIAQENLQRQGYTTYLPLIRTTRRRRSRYISSIEAMFSRYLFIELNCTTDNWAPIRSTTGVSNMVRFSGLPIAVPLQLINFFRASENEEGLLLLEEKTFNPGDKVRIIDGVFEGLRGIFQAKTSKERVCVLLNIAGQYTRVNISKHELMYA